MWKEAAFTWHGLSLPIAGMVGNMKSLNSANPSLREEYFALDPGSYLED